MVIPQDMQKELAGRGRVSEAWRKGHWKGVWSYRQFFDTLAQLFRWINQTSYEWSFAFLILALVGGMANRRPLALFGLNAIVLLNLVGLVGGLANLVVIPFRESLRQGLLFLIPPLTVIYLWRNWTRCRRVAQRIVPPVTMLVLVVLAYAFVPWLNASNQSPATLGGRVEEAAESFKRRVDKAPAKVMKEAEAIKKELPGQMHKVKKKLGEIGEKVGTKLDEWKEKDATSAEDDESPESRSGALRSRRRIAARDGFGNGPPTR